MSCWYAGLEPQVVGRDGAQLGDLQHRRHPVARSPARRPAPPARAARGSEVLASAARPRCSACESSRKCGSRSCHGPGTPSCSVQLAGDMPGTGCSGSVAARASSQSGPSAARGPSVRRLTQTWSTTSRLQVVNRLTLVAGGEDLVEVGGESPDREVLVDGLRHVVRRLDRQGDRGDHAEGAQRDDRAGEPRVGAVQPQQSPGRGDQVEGRPRRSTGCPGSGRSRASRSPPRRRPRCAAASRGCAAPARAPAGHRHLAVAHPGGDGRRGAVRRHVDRGRQAGHRDQVAGGVRDGGERVPAAQGAHPVAGGDQRLSSSRVPGRCTRAAPKVMLPAQLVSVTGPPSPTRPPTAAAAGRATASTRRPGRRRRPRAAGRSVRRWCRGAGRTGWSGRTGCRTRRSRRPRGNRCGAGTSR